MVERGSQARFTAQAFTDRQIASETLRKKFKGDGTAQAGIFRAIDDAHSAATEWAEDTIVGDELSRQRQALQGARPNAGGRSRSSHVRRYVSDLNVQRKVKSTQDSLSWTAPLK